MRMIPWGLHAALMVGALLATAPVKAQTTISRGVPVNRDVGVKIWIPAGSIRLIGWDRDSLHVEGTLGKGETFYFGGAGSGAKFGVDESPAGRVAQPARLTAYVPRGARVNVRTVTASTEASDVSGWFSTVSGGIIVSGNCPELHGSPRRSTDRFHLTVSRPSCAHALAARTSHRWWPHRGYGRLDGQRPAQTITAAGLARGRFESVTGAIVIAAPCRPRRHHHRHRQPNGPVELRLPRPSPPTSTSPASPAPSPTTRQAPAHHRPARGAGRSLSFFTDPKGAPIVVRTVQGDEPLRHIGDRTLRESRSSSKLKDAAKR